MVKRWAWTEAGMNGWGTAEGLGDYILHSDHEADKAAALADYERRLGLCEQRAERAEAQRDELIESAREAIQSMDECNFAQARSILRAAIQQIEGDSNER